MSEPRLILKHDNRRLYDKSEGHYVTHRDLIELIRKGAKILVLSKVTNADVTASVLMNSLRELQVGDDGHDPILAVSASSLHVIIAQPERACEVIEDALGKIKGAKK